MRFCVGKDSNITIYKLFKFQIIIIDLLLCINETMWLCEINIAIYKYINEMIENIWQRQYKRLTPFLHGFPS